MDLLDLILAGANVLVKEERFLYDHTRGGGGREENGRGIGNGYGSGHGATSGQGCRGWTKFEITGEGRGAASGHGPIKDRDKGTGFGAFFGSTGDAYYNGPEFQGVDLESSWTFER